MGLRPRRHTTFAVLVFALAALLLLLPATTLAASPTSSASPSSQITYRIGIQGDVDNMTRSRRT